ncbi:hypothetical protein [Nocardia xishanensis]
MRVFGEVCPEVLPVAAWVGSFADGDAVGQFDERQLGATGRGIQVQENIREAVACIGAQVRSELRGSVAGGCRLYDSEGREMAQQ